MVQNYLKRPVIKRFVIEQNKTEAALREKKNVRR